MLEFGHTLNNYRSFETIFNDVISDIDSEQCHSVCFTPLKATICVTYINSEKNQVIGRLTKDKDQYVELMEKLNNFYSNPTFRKTPNEISKGSLYVAKVNGVWYRVQLLWILRTRKTCGLFLIDEGREVVLQLSSLYVLDKWFVSEQFMRRYSIQFTTPAKSWCGFSNNGFLNGDEISEGDTLDAYVLSENEPFATLFKKATDNVVKPETNAGPLWYPTILNRIQPGENYFSHSLASNTLRNTAISRGIKFTSSFSNGQLSFGNSSKFAIFRKPSSIEDKSTLLSRRFLIPSLNNSPTRSSRNNAKNERLKTNNVERGSPNTMSASSNSDTLHEDFNLLIQRRKDDFQAVVETVQNEMDCFTEFDSTHQPNERFDAHVLNVTSPFEIYVETSETKSQMSALKERLQNLDLEKLEQVKRSYLVKDDVLLYVSENSERIRVRLLMVDDDDMSLRDVDTGEEIFPDAGQNGNVQFLRLPQDLTLNNFHTVSLGPLRLADLTTGNWTAVESHIKLRDLCETVTSACFENTARDRWVRLFDKNDRSINKLFDSYIKNGNDISSNSSKWRNVKKQINRC